MSIQSVRAIVGKAVINEPFRAGLPGSHRAELLGEFDLEPDEFAAHIAIYATTLAKFSSQLELLGSPGWAGSSYLHIGAERGFGGVRANQEGNEGSFSNSPLSPPDA